MIGNKAWKAMLAGSACALAMSATAVAQTQNFDVPAGDLKAALDRYIQQSGTQLIYRSDEVRGKTTGGVHGALSAANALAQLLEGSDFLATRDPSGEVIVTPRSKQNSTEASSTGGGSMAVETVVVTARKQSEELLKVPVAVSALSSKDIAARGIVSLDDLSNFTPGMNISNNNSGRNDRSFQQIIIRNMTPSTSTASTTSIFIDGVPVASATSVDTVDDPARIEVLKGPQSAYFGRQTFAGAINIVTKTPSSIFGGDVSALYGTHDNQDVHLSAEGPIYGDKLLFRISAREFSKSGSYKNGADTSETLGDQSTQSLMGQLLARPIDNLTIKALGMIWHDKDGPSAQGKINTPQANCLVGIPAVNPYFCGTAPALIPGYSPAANTLVDSYITNFLANPAGRVVNPSDGVKGYGLVRTAYHLGFNVDYAIPKWGITLSYLGGSSHEFYSELEDLDDIDSRSFPNTAAGIAAGGRSYYDFPYLIERVNQDTSNEFRVASDADKRFRFSFGGSYLTTYVKSDGGGGNGALVSTTNGPSGSKTTGVFYGLAYDLTSKFTLNFEGRYQIDDIAAYASPAGFTTAAGATIAPGATLADVKYYNFLPRVIGQYKIVPDVMAYATYSEGVNPGGFNTSFLTLPVALQPVATAAGIGIVVKPEKLSNIELGLKGRFFGGRATLSADVYHDLWTNQINATSVAPIDPTTGQPKLVTGSLNTGQVTLNGFEVDSTFIPIEHLTMNVSGSINDSHIDKYQCRQCTLLTGIVDYSGKQMPNTSKYSAAVGAQYGDRFQNSSDASWYLRGDFIYKSGTYDLASDTVRTPDEKLVNVRVGFTFGAWTVEGFVKNLFDDHAYTSIAASNYFTPTQANFNFPTSLVVGLPELRTIGAKARYVF